MTSSEIGTFDDSQCEYETLVNDRCLNFNRSNLVIGASKENFDCTMAIYWDDSGKSIQNLIIDDIPYQQVHMLTS